MSKYNTMETAPKDGTIILVWNYETYMIEEPVGEWMMVSWENDYVLYPHAKTRMAWCRVGSWDDEGGGYDTANSPVCWTPLPEKPDGY